MPSTASTSWKGYLDDRARANPCGGSFQPQRQGSGHSADLRACRENRGVPLDRYLTDATVLAQCQIAALERYRHDAVFALLDVNVETEALGSRLRFPKDGYPSVEHFAIEHPAAVAELEIPDPGKAGRMPVLLEAARLLRQRLENRVLVAGCVLDR